STTVSTDDTTVVSPPAVTITGFPGTSPAGTLITLGSTASDPRPGNVSFSYAWAASRNGDVVTTGSGSSFSFTPKLSGSYVVSLTVTDSSGAIATTAQTVVVPNSAPTVSISGAPITSTPGTAISLSSAVSSANPFAQAT